MINFSLLTETRTFDFTAGTITLGRDQRCTFVLPDSSVRPLHAVIREEGGRLFIEKSDRAALTFVNRQPIPLQRIELFDRDLIDIGPWTLMIRSEALRGRHEAPRRTSPEQGSIRRFAPTPGNSDDTSSSIIIM